MRFPMPAIRVGWRQHLWRMGRVMAVDALVLACYELRVPVGTIHVLRRILAHSKPGQYAVVARSGGSLAAGPPPSNVITVEIPFPKADWRGEQWMDLASVATGLPVVLNAIRKHKPQSLISVFPYEGSLALGLAASHITGLPLGAVFGDLYLENRDPADWRFKLAGPLQQRLFSRIRGLGVLNDAMAEFYRSKYGLQPVVLPPPVTAWPSAAASGFSLASSSASEFDSAASVANPAHADKPPAAAGAGEHKSRPVPKPADSGHTPAPKPTVIGYSGSINLDREEGLLRLLDLIRDNPNYQLRLFSQASQEYLQRRKLWASNVTLAFEHDDQRLVDALAQCDVLYVPLAFRAYRQEDQMRTCLGSKISDYLATGVPILSHAPAGYWHAEFFRANGCGLVVDKPDASLLKEALDRLTADVELRRTLTARATQLAVSWSGPNVAARFDSLVEQLRSRP